MCTEPIDTGIYNNKFCLPKGTEMPTSLWDIFRKLLGIQTTSAKVKILVEEYSRLDTYEDYSEPAKKVLGI